MDNVKDPSVKAYWIDEFAKYSENYAKDAVPGIQNKLGQFTSNPLIRNIIGQPHSSFDLRKMMDERKILIVNLSKGQLGEGNANLLGGMIITKIYLAAMSRADLTEAELKPLPNFYMYVDEFQSFANESFADILSEARKYKLALVVAHQYIKQMDEKVADAIFGNVGTQIMFRVGAPDAEVLEKEYAPVFTAEDMVSLGFTQIYLKLMIDGVASHPFSALTIGPIPAPKKSVRDEVIAMSRTLYGHPRLQVEKDIADWYGASGAPVAIPPSPVSSSISAELKEKEAPRAPIVKRDSSSYFEKPFRKDESRTEKYVKPFAEAFKMAPAVLPAKTEVAEEPRKISETASLSTLTRPNRTGGPIPPYRGKGVTPERLGGLKEALADVLNKETVQQPRPSPAPQLTLRNESRDFANTNKGSKNQASQVSAPRETRMREEEHPPEPSQPRETTKEVPEDVLTAILRGEDL